MVKSHEMSIEEYFSSSFNDEKAEINETVSILNEILPTFKYGIDTSGKGGWVYEIDSFKDPSIIGYSASTSSMILFAIGRILNFIIEINGDVNQYERLIKITSENIEVIK